MGLLIWIFYLGAAALAFFATSRVDFRRLTFMDGILFGCDYYIIVPMFLTLCHGELDPDFVLANSYRPYEDLATTWVIISGIMMVAVLQMMTATRTQTADETDPRILKTVGGLFVIATIYNFLSSGILSGGHWYNATSDALSNDPTFLLTKHIANFMRTAVFGVLVYMREKRAIRTRTALGIGVFVVLMDMVMTFNRVTAVYFIIMAIIMLRRYRRLLLIACTFGLFGIAQISNAWPMFRGLVGVYGYNVTGVIEAASTALERNDRDVPLVNSMNGVFESINLVTLNFVVQHSGKDMPLLKGDMFLRPLTFYLPKIVWPNRPSSFNVMLGIAINNDGDLALNSTMFGEPYANFGKLWFVALAALLCVYHFAFRAIGQSSRAIGYIACFTAFAMWRFDTVFGVISLAMSLAVMTGLRLTAGRRKRRAAPRRAGVAVRLTRPEAGRR